MTLPGHAPNPDDPNDEDQLFQYASVEPSAWTSSALGPWISARWIRERDAALHSARGLRDLPYRPRSEEPMLRGMAVECQPEAAPFARRHLEGQFTLAHRDALGRWFKRHDLEKLAVEAGVEPTDDKLRVLGTLAAFVRWAGRYPAPISQGEGLGAAAVAGPGRRRRVRRPAEQNRGRRAAGVAGGRRRGRRP